MAAMTKYVSIKTTVAVRTLTPPICGTYTGIMTIGDILKCLCKRAQVYEILPDGRKVRLDMSNYYKDNGAGLDASSHRPENKKTVEEKPARFVVPVAQPKAQVVETKTEEPIHSEGKTDESVTVDEEPSAEELEADISVVTCGQMSVDGEEEEIVTTITESAEYSADEDEEADGEEETDEDFEESETAPTEGQPTSTNQHRKKKKKKKH